MTLDEVRSHSLGVADRSLSRWHGASAGSSVLRVSTEFTASTAPTAAVTLTLPERFAPGWLRIKPLVLTIECDSHGQYLMSDDEFMVYGVGTTIAEAYGDYVLSLIEYFGLVEQGATENRYDATELRHLRAYLQPTEPK